MKIEAFVRDMNRWIDENGPNGVAKLAMGSNVSIGTINRLRRNLLPTLKTLMALSGFMHLEYKRYLPDGKRHAS